MQQIEARQDRELIEAYRRDQAEEAFAEIVRRHGGWVFSAAFRQLRDRQLAEDAAQVVFVLLAKKAGQIRTETKLSGWLFNTVQYTVKNFRRMERRRIAREHEAGRREVAAAEGVDQELAAQLDDAVARLSAKDRLAVLMRFYQEQPMAEVGRALGVSEEAARKRVQRAVMGLRQSLGANSEDAVGALAIYGLGHCPAGLSQSLCSVAAAAKAGGALPASVAAGVKGTGTLMMMAKLKLAAAVTAAVVLIAAPVSMLAMQNSSNSAAQDAAAPAPAAEALKVYSLKTDEVVKYVPKPFVAGRDELLVGARSAKGGGGGGGVRFGGGTSFSLNGEPAAPSAAIVLWDEKQPAQMTAGMGGPGGGYTIETLLENMVAHPGEQVGGDRRFLSRRLPGDFVVRRGATREQIISALAKIISERLQQPYALKFVDVPSEVYVLRGKWKQSDETQPVQLFGADQSDARGHGNGSTGAQGFGDGVLGRYIHATVVIEATEMPDMIRYAEHYGKTPADPAAVLDHVAQQTGLTWAKEKRAVKTIVLEEAKDGQGL